MRALDDPAPERAAALAEAMVVRRASGEPLQYVVGRWGFRSLDLMVDTRVLIPRPETEQVVQVALGEARSHRDGVVADLGTGSGAIALALAAEVPGLQVWATDSSDAALASSVDAAFSPQSDALVVRTEVSILTDVTVVTVITVESGGLSIDGPCEWA